jgi:RNA polymerase sigma-70 factor (ECF subfamily)
MDDRHQHINQEASVDSDTARFRELYEIHFDAVARYARARADPDTAKDAVAQAFLVAWRRRDHFLSARHPLGWLLGVTRRALADERRAASRQFRLRGRADSWVMVAPLPRDPAALVTERDAVRAAFSGLSAVDREVLALVAWDDLSPVEAAEALGCSRAAFAVRLHRARRRLCTRLRLAGADEQAVSRMRPAVPALAGADLSVGERNNS